MDFTNNIPSKSITQMQDTYLRGSIRPVDRKEAEQKSFSDILEKTQSLNKPLHFSKHAINRLNVRNINLTDSEIARLADANAQAKGKGVNNALILMNDIAFVVNTKSSTVVTMMDNKETKDNVFTNIDGAIISN